ncbi:hypothetical protein [Hyphomicrobium sp.]|uniref:hypothetical protein n=1 Tax=Hyphomicrobium sp. TaxID=82 RepID=UPI003F6EC688
MSFPKIAIGGLAAAAVFATPVLATDNATDKQKQQYLYQQQMQNQKSGVTEDGANLPAAKGAGPIGDTKANSGPGVQGPADTRTGPSTRAPAGAGDASSGASSGDAGSSGAGMDKSKDPAATQPSQDSSGVQGFPDTRTGPATKGQ